MATRPPSLPPRISPNISIRVRPTAGGTKVKSNLNVTLRTPLYGSAQGKRSRKKPFIDIKGGFKQYLKQNAFVGQIKSLANQIKNIHSLGDVIGAFKTGAALFKSFGTKKRAFASYSNVSIYGKRATGYYTWTSMHGKSPLQPFASINPRNPNRQLHLGDFITNIRARGLAKSNKFKVQFNAPPSFGDKFASHMPKLTMMCESAEFPGRTLATTDSRIYGAIYKTPNESQYSEVTFTLLCGQDFLEKQVFDLWMDNINPIKNKSETAGSGFDFEYRDDYISDVIITQYSDSGDQTYSVKLMEAYPIAMGPIQSNWQDDQFHKLQITMCYRWWEEYGLEKPSSIMTDMTNFGKEQIEFAELLAAIPKSGYSNGYIALGDTSTPGRLKKGTYGITKLVPGSETNQMDNLRKQFDSALSKVPTPIKKFGKNFL